MKGYPLVEKAHAYGRDILSGAIPACNYIKLAVERHFSDIKKQDDPEYPFYFDPAKAERVCRFVEKMIHTKGKWQRQPIILEPWQCFSIVVPWGWMRRRDHKRRFREIYEEVPRKNAKSTKLAALGNYMLAADGEKGAEVCCGATTEKQAWMVFGPARYMALWNEDYQRELDITVGARALSIMSTGSKFEPLIGDPGDGASPSYAIIDEYHEHKTDRFYEAMQTGMGAREQPMLHIITTAGTDISAPCYEKRQSAIKVLEGVEQNDELFSLIYTIDTKDDWTDFEVWKKANPNFGVSVFEDYLYSQYRQAMQNAQYQNINRCKHLDMWSNASVGWINMRKWQLCGKPVTIEDFRGCEMYLGLDLASTIDLAALMILFKVPDTGSFAEFTKGKYALFGYYYLPEETVDRPENAHYRKWRDQGLLTVTPGARTDYAYIEDDIKRLAGRHDLLVMAEPGEKKPGFNIRELAYDPYNAEFFMQSQVRKWASFPCIEVGQSPRNLSEPMKEMEALYMTGALIHDNNPMLNWQASNVILRNPANKNYSPAKQRPENKIDGIVAAIIAMSRAMAARPAPADISLFLERSVTI